MPTYFRPDPAFLKALLGPGAETYLLQLGDWKFSESADIWCTYADCLGGEFSSHANSSAPSASGVSSTPSFPPDQLSGQLSQGDLQWEVAGFHTYNKSGVAPTPQASGTNIRQSSALAQGQNSPQNSANSPPSSGTVDLEVEISNRWPLKAPRAPTGLACSGTGMGTGLQVTNVADKNVYGPNGKADWN